MLTNAVPEAAAYVTLPAGRKSTVAKLVAEGSAKAPRLRVRPPPPLLLAEMRVMPSPSVKVAKVCAVAPVALPIIWNWLPRRERISVARNMLVAVAMLV